MGFCQIMSTCNFIALITPYEYSSSDEKDHNFIGIDVHLYVIFILTCFSLNAILRLQKNNDIFYISMVFMCNCNF